jgi:hypothetical protein
VGGEYNLRSFRLIALGYETDHAPPFRAEVNAKEATGYLSHPTHFHSQVLTYLSRKTYVPFDMYMSYRPVISYDLAHRT